MRCGILDFSITKWQVLMDSEAKSEGTKMGTFEKWGHGPLTPASVTCKSALSRSRIYELVLNGGHKGEGRSPRAALLEGRHFRYKPQKRYGVILYNIYRDGGGKKLVCPERHLLLVRHWVC